MITITEAEYKSLKRDAAFLLELEDAGVDNWDGYSIAYQALIKNGGEEVDA
jgi:hypothetical protein